MIISNVQSVTRPANTTAYASGDVIGDALGTPLKFSIAGDNGCVRSAIFIDAAAEATKPDVDLFLFTDAPTIAADNAAFAPTDAQMKFCIGVISFLGANFKVAQASENGLIVQGGLDILYSSAVNRQLYGVLVARSAYAPISAEVFSVRLGSVSE